MGKRQPICSKNRRILTSTSITHLTHPQQLSRAASIKEQLDALNRELRSLLDGLILEWSCSRKETHDERGREKKNCGGAAVEVGEVACKCMMRSQRPLCAASTK